jgi:uncharacterized glyoxalase superfamily protein PhnB
MSEQHPSLVWPALQAHDPDLVIRALVALGFEETAAYRDESGVVQHAQLDWPEGGGVMLGSYSPDKVWSIKPGTAGIYVVTDDPDGVRERALTTKAEVGEMEEQDYGSRDVRLRDPEGNLWSFGTYRGEPRS